jgi:hypothetical protein
LSVQLEHEEAPPGENRPAGHCAGTLLPSHDEPARHAEHEVRVVAVPPAVNEPATHVAQLLAPAALCLASAPHAGHELLLPGEKRPAGHSVCALLPSHDEPAGHAAHEVRVVAVPPAVNEPAAQVAQLLAPAALCLASAPQAVCTLLPSHDEPALHAEHEVRVVAVPPAVNEPAAHVAQLLAPAALCLAPTPHAKHELLPAGEKCPAGHCVCALLPSHDEPAGHAAHEVRVVAVPPAVNEPAAHVAQLLVPAALCLASVPHAGHELLPPGEKRPTGHCVCALLPSQDEPAGHVEHEVRVVDVPPAVNEPAAQVAQLLAPAALCLASAPQAVCTLLPSHDEPALHAEHEVCVVAVPPAVNEPATHVAQLLAPAALCLASAPQAVRVLLPSHDEPAGHVEHEVRVVAVPPAVDEPATQVAQLLAPAALCLASAPQAVRVLLPSHDEPAGHVEHEVRVVAVPPAVNEPAAQVAQLLAPAALCLVSAPQAVCALLPSHDEPAGHAEHEVRVVDVPPAVNDPATQVVQLLAPLAKNLTSLLQSITVPFASRLSAKMSS